MAKAGPADPAQRSADMARLVTWHNGEKGWSPFSEGEIRRRQDLVRAHMAEHKIDACLFTSYHNICYLSGFLYCYFGRKYGLVLTHDGAMVIAAAIDGGQPWRRTFGDNVTYTDWRKDNYFHAVKQLAKGVQAARHRVRPCDWISARSSRTRCRASSSSTSAQPACACE